MNKKIYNIDVYLQKTYEVYYHNLEDIYTHIYDLYM